MNTIQITNGISMSIWVKLNNTTINPYARIIHFSNSTQTSLFTICRFGVSNNLYFGLWNETSNDFITNNTYNYYNDN